MRADFPLSLYLRSSQKILLQESQATYPYSPTAVSPLFLMPPGRWTGVASLFDSARYHRLSATHRASSKNRVIRQPPLKSPEHRHHLVKRIPSVELDRCHDDIRCSPRLVSRVWGQSPFLPETLQQLPGSDLPDRLVLPPDQRGDGQGVKAG